MCDTCKEPKEVKLNAPLISDSEWDSVFTLIQRHKLEYAEVEFLTSVYNRFYKAKRGVKMCGGCLKRLVNNLRHAYEETKLGM